MKLSARIIIFGLTFQFLYPASSDIQAQSDAIRIHAFHSGSYKINLRLESPLLTGIGGRNMALGGVTSSLVKDFAGAVRHPATLARVRRPIIHADFLIPLSFDPTSFVDADGMARRQLDEKLEPYHVPQNALTYPAFDISAGQANALGSGGAIMPLRFGTLAVSFYRPLLFDFDFVGNGLSTLVETSKDVGQNRTIVQFASQMNARASLQLHAASLLASYGFPLTQRLSLGIGVEWTSLNFKLDGVANVDGIMVLRQEGASIGTEYAFNDPYDESIRREDGEQNDLDQSVNAEYEGHGLQGRLSVAYQINRRWTADAAFVLGRTSHLQGFFHSIQNLIPAVNASSLLDGEGEIFDVTQLNLAKPTLTKRFDSRSEDDIFLSFPSMLSLGTSRAFGRSALIVNANFYFGEFAYAFQERLHGIKLKWSARLAADFPAPWFSGPASLVLHLLGRETSSRMQFGLGLLQAREIKNGFSYQSFPNARTNESISIPSISLGKTVRMNNAWQMALVYFSSPVTLLKISLTYDLNRDR